MEELSVTSHTRDGITGRNGDRADYLSRSSIDTLSECANAFSS